MQLEAINLADEAPLASDLLSSIKEETRKDPELQAVIELTKEGWPLTQKEVPPLARPYYTFCDTLTIQNGLVYKDDRVVIPASLRSRMLEEIHDTHIGKEGCIRRAKEAIHWPGMTTAIRDRVSRCSTCNAYRPEQQRETVIPHEVPARPWAKVGMDLFELDSVKYLITFDYYSNFLKWISSRTL